MSKHNKLAALTLAALASTALVVAPVHADDSDNHISASAGVTSQGEMTWRASLSHDWDKHWWQSDRGYLTGYWDTAYTYWEGSEASGQLPGHRCNSLSVKRVVSQALAERLSATAHERCDHRARC